MLLGLDCIVELWESMGLVIDTVKKPVVQKLARAAYEKYRNGEEDYYVASSTDDTAKEAVESFLRDVTEEAGKYVYERVNDWCFYHYYDETPEGSPDFLWILSLLALKNEYPDLSCPLGINDEVLKKIVKKIDRELVQTYNANLALAEHAKHLPPSEWDAKIFSQFAETDDPLAVMYAMINRTCFRRLWAEIDDLLDEHEMKSLLDFHRCMAERVNFPKKLIKLPEKTVGWV
jgi:histone H3/H4